MYENIDICSRKVNIESMLDKVMWLTADFDEDLDFLVREKHSFTLLELGTQCEIFS